MPEFPDIQAYLRALEARIVGHRLDEVILLKPFFLRTAEPPLASAFPSAVVALERLGKRIAIGVENDHWLVIHLMIAGRLQWQPPEAKAKKPSRNTLAVFRFDSGSLTVTEAGTKKRASLHVVAGRDSLEAFDRGGLNPLDIDYPAFAERLRRENRTLKRALTDPRILSGIGNAYSDEILHAARLSPVVLTSRLDDPQLERLFAATRKTLRLWEDRLSAGVAERFPGKVTAFRPDMAVHGRYGQPCPVCATPVQRIRYKSNETNYCPECQTGGRILADRALSRLLKQDWPRSVDELSNS